MTTDIRLTRGDHGSPDEGMCLLEAVSFIAGEPFSDTPECVSPVLAAFGRSLNDALPNNKRQQLARFIPRLIGTAGNPEADQRRGFMALDWLVRVNLPTWLRLVPELVADADALASASPIVDLRYAAVIGRLIQAVAKTAAKTDAGDASWAAWAAYWADAWAAAKTDAGTAAHRAAVTAEDAAVVAYVAQYAGDASWYAAWYAARYAWGALYPTVTALQDSAIELFDQMIEAQ